MVHTKAGNIIGSGPRRTSYVPNGLPSIGCNFPWTPVDWVCIWDPHPLFKWIEYPEVIPEPTKFVISKLVKEVFIDENKYHLIKPRVHSIISDNTTQRRSSGHWAALWMIHQGFNTLNLYGIDNWFGDLLCLENITHDTSRPHHIENMNLRNIQTDKDYILNRGIEWKQTWHDMIKTYPHVVFNFIP
jgi:hypothetical protein